MAAPVSSLHPIIIAQTPPEGMSSGSSADSSSSGASESTGGDARSSEQCKGISEALTKAKKELERLTREIEQRKSGERSEIAQVLSAPLQVLTASLEQIVRLLKLQAEIARLEGEQCSRGAPKPQAEPRSVPVDAPEPSAERSFRYLPLWLPPALLTHPQVREAIARASQGAAASGAVGASAARSGISVFFSRLAAGLSSAASVLFLIPDSMLEIDMTLLDGDIKNHDGLY